VNDPFIVSAGSIQPALVREDPYQSGVTSEVVELDVIRQSFLEKKRVLLQFELGGPAFLLQSGYIQRKLRFGKSWLPKNWSMSIETSPLQSAAR
jgi:hypothetical protein